MGGHQVRGRGTGDDGYDEEGYDESQRAEILEATGNGPSDGATLTDLVPDLGDDDDHDEDDLTMADDEIGEEAELDASARSEDEVQERFDEDALDESDEDALGS